MSELFHGLPVRRSGRVLLVNQQQELLLFSAEERLPNGVWREIWFPPGGGVEGDESFSVCASRELFEETGLVIDAESLGPIVARRSGGFFLSGIETWADEALFLASVASWDVDVSGFTPLERQQLTAHRWWPLAELATTESQVFPSAAELVNLVSRVLASGPPAEPVVLSWTNPPGWPRVDQQSR